jgi:hypothetical protein
LETTTDLELVLASKAEPSHDRGVDWPLASVFVSAVVAMYAALGYVIYTLF